MDRYATDCDNGVHRLHEHIAFQFIQHQVKFLRIYVGILRWPTYGHKPSIDGHILSELPQRKGHIVKRNKCILFYYSFSATSKSVVNSGVVSLYISLCKADSASQCVQILLD